MFKQLQSLYNFVDKTIDSIYQQHPDEIMCKPGCADCCHAVFDVSFIEASYLASYLKRNPGLLASQQEQATAAAVAYEEMLKKNKDAATQRIRCPLLGEDDLCLAHKMRPINCRTYGTPTVIEGQTHVCGFSGFTGNLTYATVDLAPLQQSLNAYSVQLVGPDFGNRRFPLAWVFLKPNFFLPPGA
ncbi:MAG: hypothetical protein CSB34_01260 [Desulfobulbus propionicus]|nr:MAG: hypothetical protein CSB34_01260 [Desulfobulbus propionicus]